MNTNLALVDELYAELDDLAGESLDGFIDDRTYLIRKLQILDICASNGITQADLDRARERRYGNR